jgi:hypothetical protein
MSKAHVFSGVTLATLIRMDEAGSSEYTVDLDPDRRGGTVRRPTPMGDVVVRFAHDQDRSEMRVTVVSKPKLLPAAVIWAGVAVALGRAADPAAGKDHPLP